MQGRNQILNGEILDHMIELKEATTGRREGNRRLEQRWLIT